MHAEEPDQRIQEDGYESEKFLSSWYTRGAQGEKFVSRRCTKGAQDRNGVHVSSWYTKGAQGEKFLSRSRTKGAQGSIGEYIIAETNTFDWGRGGHYGAEAEGLFERKASVGSERQKTEKTNGSQLAGTQRVRRAAFAFADIAEMTTFG